MAMIQRSICEECGGTFEYERRSGPIRKICSRRCRLNRIARTRTPRTGKSEYYYRVIKPNPKKLTEHRERATRNSKRVRGWLADYKLAQGCVDCGYREHFAALQLDHTGPKAVEIATARTSIRRLQEEIDAGKCVVRCANCHAVKTWREKQDASG